MAKKLVLVGRDVHLRTKSDNFFLDIMREVGDVEIVRRDKLSHEETRQAIDKHSPDVIVHFQTKPHAKKIVWPLRRVRQIWVPMWDYFDGLRRLEPFIYRYCGLKMISFSERCHEHFLRRKLNSLRCTYFPKPNLERPSIKGEPPYTLFFWQRVPEVSLDTVSKLFEPGIIKKVIHKQDTPKEFMPAYPFEVEPLNEWLPKEELFRRIQEADYYLAPRLQEGLGHSFVEAMAMGKVIIGNADGTMDEYIQDGVTGHLFNADGRISARWQSPKELAPNIAKYCQQAHEGWLADLQRIKAMLSD